MPLPGGGGNGPWEQWKRQRTGCRELLSLQQLTPTSQSDALPSTLKHKSWETLKIQSETLFHYKMRKFLWYQVNWFWSETCPAYTNVRVAGIDYLQLCRVPSASRITPHLNCVAHAQVRDVNSTTKEWNISMPSHIRTNSFSTFFCLCCWWGGHGRKHHYYSCMNVKSFSVEDCYMFQH